MRRNARAKAVPAPLVQRYEGVHWPPRLLLACAMLAARGGELCPRKPDQIRQRPRARPRRGLGGAARAARAARRGRGDASREGRGSPEALRSLTSDFALIADPVAWVLVRGGGAALLDGWAALLRGARRRPVLIPCKIYYPFVLLLSYKICSDIYYMI